MKLPKLIFMHLDKSGGTSVFTAIGKAYEENGQTWIRTDRPGECDQDFIVGHFGISEITNKLGYRLITVLRNPVERIISFANWLTTTRENEMSIEHVLARRTVMRSIDEFISSFVKDGLYASRYSLGHPSVENAVSVLKSMHLVGFTDDLDSFWRLLSKRLETDLPELGRENVSEKTNKFSDGQIKLIGSMLKDDGAIYERYRDYAKEPG